MLGSGQLVWQLQTCWPCRSRGLPGSVTAAAVVPCGSGLQAPASIAAGLAVALV